MTIDVAFITGMMLGIEFPTLGDDNYLVIDLLIIRIMIEFHSKG